MLAPTKWGEQLHLLTTWSESIWPPPRTHSVCLSPECIHFLRSKFASIPINMPVSKPNGSDQRTKAKEVWRRATAVCFDVDSTLIQEEGIDKLADYCGAGEQVAEWYLNFVCGIASSSCWTASRTSLARSACAAPGRRSRGNAYVHSITWHVWPFHSGLGSRHARWSEHVEVGYE